MKLFEAYGEIKVSEKPFLGQLNKMEAATEKSTRTMQQKFDALGPTFKKVGMGMTVAGAAITGALTACIVKSVSFGDKLDKMSKRTGVSVESLSALKYAADLSGASIDTVENSLRFMTRAMDDASKGTGEAKDTFEKLGISVTDVHGKLRPTVEVMKEAATKIAAMTNETERIAAATDIFGSRYGTQLLPLLMEGGEGIENLMNKAQELGIVMSTEAATKAAEFNDRLDEMKASLGMVAIKIGTSLLPVIKPLIENIRDIAGRVSKWVEENPKLAATLAKIVLGIGAFLTVAGPVLIFLPKIIALIPMLTMGFHAMLGPIGLITLAITAAVAAFIYFYTTNKKFKDFINAMGAHFKLLGTNIKNWATWFKDNFVKIMLTAWSAVTTLAKNAAENLLTVFKWLGDSISKWGAWFASNFLNVWKNLFGAVQSSIMNFGKNIVAQVGWIWEKIKHPFTKVPRPDWTPLFEDFKAEWGELPKFTELKMKSMAEGIKVYWDEMPGWIIPVQEATKTLGKEVEKLGKITVPVLNKAKEGMEGFGGATKRTAEELAKLKERMDKLRAGAESMGLAQEKAQKLIAQTAMTAAEKVEDLRKQLGLTRESIADVFASVGAREAAAKAGTEAGEAFAYGKSPGGFLPTIKEAIEEHLAPIYRKQEEKILAGWNAFLGEITLSTFKTYEELHSLLEKLSVKDRITLTGIFGDWQDNVGKIKNIWESFTSSARASLENAFTAFVKGGSTIEQTWNKLVDVIKTRFLTAMAEVMIAQSNFNEMLKSIDWAGGSFEELEEKVVGFMIGLREGFDKLFGSLGEGWDKIGAKVDEFKVKIEESSNPVKKLTENVNETAKAVEKLSDAWGYGMEEWRKKVGPAGWVVGEHLVPAGQIPSLQLGGLITKTGIAKVERGERIVRAGDKISNVTMNINFGPGSKFTEFEKHEVRRFFYDDIYPLILEAKERTI